MSVNRRIFLSSAALAAVGGGWALKEHFSLGTSFDTALRYPGRPAGHAMRDGPTWTSASLTSLPVLGTTDIAIVGSGIAALSCAWQLNKMGRKNFVLLKGPAPLGNAAFGTSAAGGYPQGAHYLPIPGKSCPHVRHILHDLGVLQSGVDDERPVYDERYVVHAGAERVLHNGVWHEGVRPPPEDDPAAYAQWDKVLAEISRLGALQDSNGKHVFQMPLAEGAALSTPEAQKLDTMSFQAWLTLQGVDNKTLAWFFDYCCKDEYGVDASLVSAWVGIHYFNSRRGKSRNTEPGAVLTWPQGTGFLAHGLSQQLAPAQQRAGTVLHIAKTSAGQTQSLVVVDENGKPGLLKAKRVVVAAPLFIARRIAPQSFEGLETVKGPQMSPWLVSNFFLDRFPSEKPGTQLSWDNVVSGSAGLGYVVSTHQSIASALPEKTVFTTYTACGAADNAAQRKWLSAASKEELLELATTDLAAAYGNEWKKWCTAAELTVHGHAMAVPAPGFLTEKLTARARASIENKEAVLFAHSDLSGYSVFEEASYWGVRAALAL